jgi:phage shock protein C
MMTHKLTRSAEDQIIAGVCSGLAKYFDTDPVLVRIIFFLLIFLGGSGVFLYLALWLILPTDQKITEGSETDVVKEFKPKRDQKEVIGFLLILVGGLFLLENFFPDLEIGRLWPLILILLGFAILNKRSI